MFDLYHNKNICHFDTLHVKGFFLYCRKDLFTKLKRRRRQFSDDILCFTLGQAIEYSQ